MSCIKLLTTLTILMLALSVASVMAGGTSEFCLDGELDLGARYQGTEPKPGEYYPTTWCVITEDDSHRVLFSGSGRSNPDMHGSWIVAYLPPDTVRIVNRESPPDVEFQGTANLDEALRVRRVDPKRLFEEVRESPDAVNGVRAEISNHRVLSAKMSAMLPLRGRVDVDWYWDWTDSARPALRLMLDDELLFKATGRWREIPDDEARSIWAPTPGADPLAVSGDRWPAQVDMQIDSLAEGVYLVRGVRTGFQHLVVDTDEGLVVADAPAGWVEFHHIPPSDLVPGLGVSGLSERFIDFLGREFPDRPIRAVALTHFHDDHAGGARAFAAAGAKIYVTQESARFFATALNRPTMPDDRLAAGAGSVEVLPVKGPVTIGGETNRVKLVPLGPGPHAYAMLGVWAIDRDVFFVSDVHVPRSEAVSPREERAMTECWFAEWALNNLPPGVQVANSHSAPLTPVSRLVRYLESEPCMSDLGSDLGK